MPYAGIWNSFGTIWNLCENTMFCSTNVNIKDPNENIGCSVMPTNLIMSSLFTKISLEIAFAFMMDTSASVSKRNIDLLSDT